MTRTMSVRLDDEQAATVEMVARIDGKPVSGVIREALAAYFAERESERPVRGRMPDGREGDIIAMSDFGWGSIRYDDGTVAQFTDMDGPVVIPR